MVFDPENPVIQRCAQGMELEGSDPAAAKQLFLEAWEMAANDLEKLTAAHYVARQQSSVSEKLLWDERALQHALNLEDDQLKSTYPSLYLNIAKCHEDLGNADKALEHYLLAEHFTAFLPDDGFGNLLRSGIRKGIERVG